MKRQCIFASSFLCATVLAANLADPGEAHGEVSIPTVASGAESNHALQQVLENIAFWEQQGQLGVALEEADHALTVAPRNADIIAIAARLAFAAGDSKAGEAYRIRLQLVAPDDPRLKTLSAELRRTPTEQHMLDEARKLSNDGHKDQALKLYRDILHGKIPTNLAAEFYQTLGSTSQAGFDEAVAELGGAVERSPADMMLKLAYAQLQTWHEETRALGVEQLQGLTQQPTVAEAARKSWSNALRWQGPDIQLQKQIETYLRQYPGDKEIEAKLNEVRESLPDEGVLARMRGYEAKTAGRSADAEREFLAALAIDLNDVEAMIPLALIRRQQKRFAEATKFIDRALELAPDRRSEFLVALGQTGQVDPASEKLIRGQYAEVTRLTQQGNYLDAEKLLRSLTKDGQTAGSLFVLGDIQARSGRLADAEGTLRHAWQMNTRNADVAVALAEVLTRQGRTQDAAAMYAQAQDLYVKAGNTRGPQAVNRSRAEQLRTSAAAAGDLQSRISIYRTALVIDPSYSWLRLDLADALRKQGKLAEARRLMADAVNVNEPNAEALQAAIVFAQHTGDLELASQLIGRLPVAQQTQQMNDLQKRVAIREEIQQTIQTSSPATLRFRLVALAAEPDPTGTRGSEVGQVLVRVADSAAVRSAISAALAATPAPTARQRLAYSWVLLAASLTQDIERMVGGLDHQNLSIPLKEALNQVLDGAAIQQSDKLNRENRAADAFDILTPRLAVDPSNINLNLALSRLYQSNGKQSEANSLIETLRYRNPKSLEIRLAAVDSAISQGDLNDADRVVAEGVEMFPGEPLVYVMSAHVAKARGRNGLAITDLQTARELRERQLVSQ